MKKKFLRAAVCLAGAAVLAGALSGCSVRVPTSFASNWLSNPSQVNDPAFYERLEYALSFTNDDTGSICVEVDAANSSFVIETEIVSDTLPDGQQYANIYHTHLELTLSATYSFTNSDEQTFNVAEFGGEHDSTESDADDPAKVVSDVWYYTKADNHNLEPIYSTTTCYSYSPIGVGSGAVVLYNYSYTVDYDETAATAAVSYTDHWADLPDDELRVSDTLSKAKLLSTEQRTFEGLQDDYTAIDSVQLLFAARGLNYSAESSSTLTVFNGNSGMQNVAISCSEIVDRPYNFTLGGETIDRSVSSANVTFSVSSNGSNSGPSHTVYYAQKESDSSNPLRCLPLQIDKPYGYGIGTMTMRLTNAAYTRGE